MIWGLRAAFAIILAMIGRTLVITWWASHAEWGPAPWWWGFFAGLATSVVFIFIEVAFTRRFIAVISIVMLTVLVVHTNCERKTPWSICECSRRGVTPLASFS